MGSVLVWGGISLNSWTPLYNFEGTLNAQRYRDEILQPNALPSLQEIGTAAPYQDDNARPHRAHVVYEFMRPHDIERIPWPVYSSDLAPIEQRFSTFFMLWIPQTFQARGSGPP